MSETQAVGLDNGNAFTKIVTELLRVIILTGGPADLIADELQKQMETPVEVPQEPALANARGFYKFAMMTSQ